MATEVSGGLEVIDCWCSNSDCLGDPKAGVEPTLDAAEDVLLRALEEDDEDAAA
jgi:hypothetical protein